MGNVKNFYNSLIGQTNNHIMKISIAMLTNYITRFELGFPNSLANLVLRYKT